VSYKFTVDDVQNFGLYYAKTLKEWRKNFDKYLLRTNNEMEDTFVRM
ncbi:unnamed protein product, partial [marine sediment metagenome]